MMQSALFGTHLLCRRGSVANKIYKGASATLAHVRPTPGLPGLHPARCYLERLQSDLKERFDTFFESALSDTSQDDTEGRLPPKLFHYTSSTAAESIVTGGSLRSDFNDELESLGIEVADGKFGPGVYTTDQAPPCGGPQLVEQNCWIPDASFVFAFDSEALKDQAYHINDTRFSGYVGEGGFFTILENKSQRGGSVSLDLNGNLPYTAFRWVEAQGWEQVQWHAAAGEFRRVLQSSDE